MVKLSTTLVIILREWSSGRVSGRKETARGMKTAAAGIPGYETHRTSKTFGTNFDKCSFQDTYSYAYIMKYFC